MTVAPDLTARPPIRPEALADAFEILIDDPNLASALDRVCLLHEALQRFDWSGTPLHYRAVRARFDALDVDYRSAIFELGLAVHALHNQALSAPVPAVAPFAPTVVQPPGDDRHASGPPRAPASAEVAAEAVEPAEAGPVEAEPVEVEPAEVEPVEVAPVEVAPAPLARLPAPVAGGSGDDEPFVPAKIVRRPSAVPLTPAVLGALQSGLSQRTWTERPGLVSEVVDAVYHVRGLLGSPPTDFEAPGAVQTEIGMLRKALSDDGRATWRHTPTELHHAIVSFVVARLRVLQDEHLDDDTELLPLFGSLTSWLLQMKMPHVNGLRREHKPVQGKRWSDELRYWQRRFRKLCEPYLPQELSAPQLSPGESHRRLEEVLDRELSGEELRYAVLELLDAGMEPDTRVCRLLVGCQEELKGHGDLASLRRAVRDQANEDAEERAYGGRAPLGESWAGWRLTAGRRGVIVGGSPRDDVRARLQRQLGFAELEWIAIKGARKAQALEQSLRTGGVDVVFVLIDFVSHSVTERLRPSRVPLVLHVPHGYGTAALKAAVEQMVLVGEGGR